MVKLSLKSSIYATGALLCIGASLAVAQKMDNNVPMGWAVFSKHGTENTIGGHDGKVVTAKTMAELSNYAKSSEPLVIIADGSFSGTVALSPNKTLIGAGSGAKLKGSVLMNNNTILRNFDISGGGDAIQVNGNKHHVWIDHCNLHACGDGLLDITNNSDIITVSWVRFSNHHKTMLINNGGEDDAERDLMNVTLSHLFWDGSATRNPRAGYGHVHIQNCYYKNNGYGIHMYWEVKIYIEGNYFSGTKDAISHHKPGAGTNKGGLSWDGCPVLVNNKLEPGCVVAVKDETDPKKRFTPTDFYLYDWAVTKVEDVPDVVSKGAGTSAEASKIVAIPTPGQGSVKVKTTPTLKWTKVGSLESNKVYFGKTFPPPEVKTVSGTSFEPGKLDAGTVYYWKINDGDVWKFRTDGTPVAINSSLVQPAKKSLIASDAVIKGIHENTVPLFIGVQKGDDQLYDLNGREHINNINKVTNVKKVIQK